LGEAAGLDATDAQLANQITQQQIQLRADVLAQQVITPAVPVVAVSKSGTKSASKSTTTTTSPPTVHVVPPPLYTLATCNRSAASW